MPANQRKRRWLQFSLRTLMLATLFVCTFFAGRWSREREMAELRQEVGLALETAGGQQRMLFHS